MHLSRFVSNPYRTSQARRWVQGNGLAAPRRDGAYPASMTRGGRKLQIQKAAPRLRAASRTFRRQGQRTSFSKEDRVAGACVCADSAAASRFPSSPSERLSRQVPLGWLGIPDASAAWCVGVIIIHACRQRLERIHRRCLAGSSIGACVVALAGRSVPGIADLIGSGFKVAREASSCDDMLR